MRTHHMTATEIEQAGREIRLNRERLRAAIDRRPVHAADDEAGNGGWHFANENGTLIALACGPVVRTQFRKSGR